MRVSAGNHHQGLPKEGSENEASPISKIHADDFPTLYAWAIGHFFQRAEPTRLLRNACLGFLYQRINKDIQDRAEEASEGQTNYYSRNSKNRSNGDCQALQRTQRAETPPWIHQ